MAEVPTQPPHAGFDPRRPDHWLAFAAGAGLLPKAPGTWGTLAAIPLYLLLARLPLPIYVLMLVGLALVGVWACGRVGRDLGIQDHPAIVWDEVVGYLLTMTAAPPGWPWVLAGFLLFRGLDIWKPWPIRWLDQQVGGGLGVMLDDLAAGALALALLQGGQSWLG
jgi:phosphatidylglycerophosphatase A